MGYQLIKLVFGFYYFLRQIHIAEVRCGPLSLSSLNEWRHFYLGCELLLKWVVIYIFN